MRDLAEEGKVQFKERIIDAYDVGCELVAMSNSHGGKVVVGIDDKTGKINPLSFMELQETTNLISNMASENVVPSILIEDILSVTSMPRNTFLFNNAIYLLPYTGAGSGMARVIDYRDRMTFVNNERLNEFVVTIHRSPEIVSQNEEESKVIGVSNQTANRNKYIVPLLDAGFIERTIPESPNAPNQKYRKVKRGNSKK